MARNLVTIITPVYNVSEYLEMMLQSILEQSYEDWELILVDDGSTDCSGEICETFCKSEVRARVIHQENQGQAIARDVAIAESQGKWIVFVDADDVVLPDYISRMVSSALARKTDIVECNYVEFEGAVPDVPKSASREIVVRGRKEVAKIALDYKTAVSAVWGKLFCARLFSGLRCPQGQLYEDEYLIPRIYARAESYCMISDKLYFYRRRLGSTMTEHYDRRRAFANIDVLDDRLTEFLGVFDLETDGILLFRYCMDLCTVLNRIWGSECGKGLTECVLCCESGIKKYGRECIRLSCVPLQRKMLVGIAMFSPKAVLFMRDFRRILKKRSVQR